MTTGMTMGLWIMVGLFVGAALVFTIGAIAFAAWYQRFQHEMDQPTSTPLKSINPKKDLLGLMNDNINGSSPI